VFCLLIFGVKAKKSASIHAHQRLGTLRIGTLRDHESVAAASYLRRKFPALCRPQSQAPPFIPKSHEMVACLDCRISQRYSALRGNFCERCRKLTFAGEKLRVSAVQSSITCLLSIAALAIHLPYSNREMNGIHPLEKKIFCRHKKQRENPVSPRKNPIRLHFSAEKWFRFRVYGGQTIHDVPALEMSGYANKHPSLHALAVVYRPGLA
jgi:hypothetical protein